MGDRHRVRGRKIAAVLVGLWLVADAALAASDLEIISVDARLFLGHTGSLSTPLTDRDVLRNTIIGEGSAGEPSIATLVDVVVKGTSGEFDEDWRVDLVVTNSATGAIQSRFSQRPGVLSAEWIATGSGNGIEDDGGRDSGRRVDVASLARRRRTSAGTARTRIAELIKLSKADLGRISKVSKSSVRFDANIPEPVTATLREIANIANLVDEFFAGDIEKVRLWFEIANPMLGNISPSNLIRIGRYKRLLSFVLSESEADAVAP